LQIISVLSIDFVCYYFIQVNSMWFVIFLWIPKQCHSQYGVSETFKLMLLIFTVYGYNIFISVMAKHFLRYFTKMIAHNMYPDGLTNSSIFYSRYILLLFYCMVYKRKYNGVISVFVILGQPLTDLLYRLQNVFTQMHIA